MSDITDEFGKITPEGKLKLEIWRLEEKFVTSLEIIKIQSESIEFYYESNTVSMSEDFILRDGVYVATNKRARESKLKTAPLVEKLK